MRWVSIGVLIPSSHFSVSKSQFPSSILCTRILAADINTDDYLNGLRTQFAIRLDLSGDFIPTPHVPAAATASHNHMCQFGELFCTCAPADTALPIAKASNWFCRITSHRITTHRIATAAATAAAAARRPLRLNKEFSV
ncbi:hypothetical protein SAMD00023353_0100050 [Rosellinia necatrix]|uniref:Uncharacterized protein n=1 Tax=Rosellinia necatrix TaxID=77044 RepID=A0A1S7UJK8_ROSNE|nr:hypothetical protein SAMD00023353_0100050 [Rosellinia necatrix]